MLGVLEAPPEEVVSEMGEKVRIPGGETPFWTCWEPLVG